VGDAGIKASASEKDDKLSEKNPRGELPSVWGAGRLRERRSSNIFSRLLQFSTALSQISDAAGMVADLVEPSWYHFKKT
jgi:hypothetical protein